MFLVNVYKLFSSHVCLFSHFHTLINKNKLSILDRSGLDLMVQLHGLSAGRSSSVAR